MDLGRVARAGGGYPLAVVAVVVVAAVLLPFRGLLSSPTVMLLFVPAIIGVARLAGVRASAFAAVLAFFVLDLAFAPPYYRLTVASLSEWLGLLVFLFVALTSGQQTARLRERERLALRGRDELALLNRLSFQIASESSTRSVAQFVVTQVAEVLGAPRVAIYLAGVGSGAPLSLAQAGLARPSSHEAEFVAWVLRSSKAVGMPSTAGVPYDQRMVSVGPADALPGVAADGVYVPLQATSSLEGVLFAELGAGLALTADDTRLLAAVANLAAAALERERLEAEASHAEVLREADRLKSTLVSSVSHELKTPLAAATARVTGLVEEIDACEPARIREELVEVSEDLVRLNDSIGDLLDLSRLESDAWEPRFEPCDVRDILGTVSLRISARERGRVRFDIAEDVPEVRADFAQLARALYNLIENALNYAPADTPVTVGTRAVGEVVEISVADTGPGVPADERARVFEKFYRGSASSGVPSGTGLGLAIAREIIRTHDGMLRVEDAMPHGARFVLTVPRANEENA